MIYVSFEHYQCHWVEFEIQDPGLWWADLSPRDTLLKLLGHPRVEWLEAAAGGRYCVFLYRGQPAGWSLAFERPEDAALYALTWT